MKKFLIKFKNFEINTKTHTKESNKNNRKKEKKFRCLKYQTKLLKEIFHFVYLKLFSFNKLM